MHTAKKRSDTHGTDMRFQPTAVLIPNFDEQTLINIGYGHQWHKTEKYARVEINLRPGYWILAHRTKK